AKTGKNPDKEFKGTFNVRIPPDLHKKLALKANAKNESLNSMVVRAIEQYVFTEESQQKEEGVSEAYNIFSLPIHENTVVIDTKTTANQRNFYQRPLFK
ncbi:MAG: type II toxin-antitoxin system HicB family antitoxin, partial [Clostridiales bacterium]|nr:type II toxin-antitoxin system HicB family antitoxin [Clostridiales bacterium]